MFGPISELLHGADIHIRRVLTWKMNEILIKTRYIKFTLLTAHSPFHYKNILHNDKKSSPPKRIFSYMFRSHLN